jgi:hypothetical protein
MSIRRAVEAHFKWTLDPYVPDIAKGWGHQVVESLRLEDRPLPAVIITSSAAQPIFEEFPQAHGNWKVPVSVVVMSSLDETTVDVHSELAYFINRVFKNENNRTKSKVQGMKLYDIQTSTTGQENDGRRMVNVLNYDVLVNYMPEDRLP